VDVSDISLSVTEVQVEQALTLLTGNLGEPVTRPDVLEVEKVTNALTSVNFDAKSWAAQAPAPEPVVNDGNVWAGVVVGVNVAKVGLDIFYGNGVADDGTSSILASFVLRKMALSLTIKSDQSMALRFSLFEIVLQDARAKSPHTFKVRSSSKEKPREMLNTFLLDTTFALVQHYSLCSRCSQPCRPCICCV